MHFSQVFKDKMFASIKGDKDIAIRVTTIQKTQKPDLKAGLRVGCLRVASGKKKAGRPAGPDPSRRGFYGGEWEPWEVRSRGVMIKEGFTYLCLLLWGTDCRQQEWTQEKCKS